jgi:hypothetical protein
MAKRDYDYERFATELIISKAEVVEALVRISQSPPALERIAEISARLRPRLRNARLARPKINGKSTNPYVLAALALRRKYGLPRQLDRGLVQQKEFSSLETAVGRAVEETVPMVYGWETVRSKAHSPTSQIDCARSGGGILRLAALKSGPSCINDTMANKIGSAVVEHCQSWAEKWQCNRVEFTVGMLYSTGRKSNKKDWRAVSLAEAGLRNSDWDIVRSCLEQRGEGLLPFALPEMVAGKGSLRLTMTVRHGVTLWDYLAAPVPDAVFELCCGLVGAAVRGDNNEQAVVDVGHLRTEELAAVVRVPPNLVLPGNSPVSLPGLPWLFLFVRHFVDGLTEESP